MEIKFCSQCGSEVSNSMKFCSRCGSKLNTEDNNLGLAKELDTTNTLPAAVNPITGAVSQSGPTVQLHELEIFVGSKKYLEKWGYYDSDVDDIPKSWNWSAFFFSSFWMAYRKMYLYAAIVLLIQITIVGVLEFIPSIDNPAIYLVKLLAKFFFFVLVGNYGNSMYHAFAMKKIFHIKQNNPSLTDEPLNTKIKLAGGTSIVMTVVYAIITVFVLAILSSL